MLVQTVVKTSPFNFRTLNDSLSISISKLKTQNDSLHKILEGKLICEITVQKAQIWQPKAQYLQFKTNEIVNYIEKAISSLKLDSSMNVSEYLYERLNIYKGEILRIDQRSMRINKDASIITHKFDSVKQNDSKAFDSFFYRKCQKKKGFSS
ncbi:MAG: hypothetical protein IPO42_10385 [Chitinophagaceae bacterium]|nr:hypothetical protein [Chitinophagaceae bacterium]